MVNIGEFLGKITIAFYVPKNLVRISFSMIFLVIFYFGFIYFVFKNEYIYILIEFF